jgi:glucose/arabinose dehydrogenase
MSNALRNGRPSALRLTAVTLGLSAGLAVPELAGQVAPTGDTTVTDGEVIEMEQESVRVEVVARDLTLPTALAFLPDGRALLAERMAGRLSFLDAATGKRSPVHGLPPMHLGADREEEGGLFDVRVHPRYDRNGWIYISYSEATTDGNTTVVDRFRLAGNTLTGRERLFTARPHVRNSIHFGGRMALVDGHLFVTVGERNEPERAQDLGQHHGKIVRLHDDGRVPKNNPFARRSGALPEIWSWGHRNPQGLARNPVDGRLWAHEHGPRGGDEVNIVRPRANYGWPIITYGREYTGEPVGAGLTERDGLEQPVYYWLPSIAPSGMVFYRGRAFARWRGSLLVGAMARGHLNRLVVRDGRVLHEERLPAGKRWRVRLVSEGPDGSVYLGTDAGYLLRLTPVQTAQATR